MKKFGACVLMVTVLLAGCSGGTDAVNETASAQPPASSSPSVSDPTDAPLGLSPVTPDGGEAIEVLPGLTATIPEGAVRDDSVDAQGSATTVTFRMAGTEDGIPALQVASAGATSDSVAAETWVQETAMTANPTITSVHRSAEAWPGATEAVALAWDEAVATVDGSTKDVEVLTLWLRDESSRTFKLTAIAPAGALESSSAYAALLTAQLSAQG